MAQSDTDAENLRNEPNLGRRKMGESLNKLNGAEAALDASVQGSEFKVQGLPNEPTSTSQASEIPDLRSQIDGNLPNEPNDLQYVIFKVSDGCGAFAAQLRVSDLGLLSVFGASGFGFEVAGEFLPNEPIALGAPVQGSEFKVQSSEELRNEPTAEGVK